ncbi:DUF1345 domain-containing protein [Oscillatoria sp. FACHB-1406]|uniref:DUF1345 domain-containing protein n=1 Tax=Oscillatoria sp. FACHB-1406 TaxID=2692846 RepID=UPI0016885228|nr:DUF1345 domain-containing protein [Oscillatoria sp. FACHB-1406]MBD2576476.1 DUF1345 domain-containing protein [Oscillatoria sp. FACHB-1406]
MTLKWFERLDAKPRLLLSIAVTGLVYFFLSHGLTAIARVIISWDAGVIVFLVLVWLMTKGATAAMMRKNAQRQDENRLTILSLVVASACISLLAIAFLLKGSKNLPEWHLELHVALGVITIVASWLLAHTMFALHYAHLYYNRANNDSLPEGVEALDFPQEHQPDYWDFFYFSFVIGMTGQVSDVAIASRPMRRLALIQGIMSFFFNTVVLALTINLVAGLI